MSIQKHLAWCAVSHKSCQLFIRFNDDLAGSLAVPGDHGIALMTWISGGIVQNFHTLVSIIIVHAVIARDGETACKIIIEPDEKLAALIKMCIRDR